MKRSVIHKQILRPGPFGGTVNTTLCGRVATGSDGMNIGGEVTCKFCLKILAKRESAGEVKR
jgi:hypothetical protein